MIVLSKSIFFIIPLGLPDRMAFRGYAATSRKILQACGIVE